MNFSETIKEIVRLNSINVLQNDSLFLAMFSDLAPDLKKERKIIKRICEESMMHAFFILVTCKDGDRETVINAIVQELKNEIGLTEEWIQEIIDAFDLAFDLKVSSTILRNKIDNTDDMTPLSKLFKQNFGDANHCDGQIQSIDQILSLSAVNEEYDPEDFGKFINPRHIKADGVLIPCGVGNADNGFILHGISPVSKSKHECAPLLGLIYNFLIRNSKMSEDDIPHVLENDDDLYGSDHKMIYRYTIVIISAIRSGYTNFNELLIRPLDYTKECRMALKVINEYIRIFFTIAGKKPITYRLATKATTTVSMKSKNAKIYVVDNTQYTVARTLYFAPKINYKLDERHKDALEDLLREISPFTSFKDGQYEAICKMINSTKHAVCIMPTGSGKSLVYYFMSILQPLPIFVISPTDILIRDQIRNLRKFHKIDNIAHLKMVEGVDFERLELCNSLIYLNPATFQNRGLLVRFRHLNADQLVGAVVLDEIHCLSNWGHDFRPEYLMLSKNLNRILDRTVFMGFTATANYTVVEDIQKQLGIPQENFFSPVSFDKYNASYHYSDYQTTSEMLSAVSELATKIVADNERAIVFTKNDKISRLVADAIGYEADVFLADNPKAYYQFADGTCKILVTSEDLGIGINFSNVTNVIHFGLPVSKNEYVQEIGRAGRGDEYIHSYVLFLTPSPDNVDPLLLKRESDINKTAQILNLMDNDYSDIYHKMNMNADTSDVLMERLLEVHDDLVYKYRALAAVYDEKQVDEIKKYLYMLYVTGCLL